MSIQFSSFSEMFFKKIYFFTAKDKLLPSVIACGGAIFCFWWKNSSPLPFFDTSA